MYDFMFMLWILFFLFFLHDIYDYYYFYYISTCVFMFIKESKYWMKNNFSIQLPACLPVLFCSVLFAIAGDDETTAGAVLWLCSAADGLMVSVSIHIVNVYGMVYILVCRLYMMCAVCVYYLCDCFGLIIICRWVLFNCFLRVFIYGN